MAVRSWSDPAPFRALNIEQIESLPKSERAHYERREVANAAPVQARAQKRFKKLRAARDMKKATRRAVRRERAISVREAAVRQKIQLALTTDLERQTAMRQNLLRAVETHEKTLTPEHKKHLAGHSGQKTKSGKTRSWTQLDRKTQVALLISDMP